MKSKGVIIPQILLSKMVGIFLILMAIVAAIGYGYSFGSFYVSGNTNATIENLIKSISALCQARMSFVVILVLDVVISLAIYALYKRISKFLSLLSASLRLVYSVILGIAIYHLFLVPMDINFLTRNTDIVMDHLNLFLKIWSLGLIIFGAHLFTLGLLLKKTLFTPRLIYAIILIAGCSYFLTHSAELVIPDYDNYKSNIETILFIPMALSEIMFAIWLLLKRY